MRKIISIISTALLIGGVISGCQSPQKNEVAKQSEKAKQTEEVKVNKNLEKVTLMLDWTPNTNHTGVYVAQDKGYFEENGFEVEVFAPIDTGSLDVVASGKADFGISYQEQITYARTAKNSLPVKAIAAIIQHNTSGFASPIEKGIKKPKDFEGKTYGGYSTPIEEKFIKALMDKENADFSKVKIANIGQADFFAATKKDVDFAWVYEGWDGISAKLKNSPIDFIKLQDIDPQLDFYTPVVVASESSIKNKKERIVKFLKALEKGYVYSIKNPEESAKILVKLNQGIDEKLAIESQKYLANEYISDAPRWGYMKKEIWDGFSKWMYKNKLIEKELVVDEAYTNEFLQ